jgi:hypothetical protein
MHLGPCVLLYLVFSFKVNSIVPQGSCLSFKC